MSDSFLEACSTWLCDGYSADIRYLAEVSGEGGRLLSGALLFYPLPAVRDDSLELSVSGLVAGQIQHPLRSREDLLGLVSDAIRGILNPAGGPFSLQLSEADPRHSEPRHDDWFSPLEIDVHGDAPTGTVERRSSIDHALRTAETPFDGLQDLVSRLGLPVPQPGRLSTLEIRVSPPVDLILDQCALLNDRLQLTLHAHPNFDVSRVLLALRTSLGNGTSGRMQIAHTVRWGEVEERRRTGRLEVDVPNAESALAMLVVGSRTVRRQWFQDPSRAPNYRLVAVQHFDRDLRMIRQNLFEANDSPRFEAAVGALLFLLGTAPAVQLETDAPDLIGTTPSGKVVLVECTMRFADVATKVGKLIGRSAAAAKVLQASGHFAEVVPMLVCRLPRDEIGVQKESIKQAGALLIAAEEISDALLRTRFRQDPDRWLRELQIAQSVGAHGAT